MKRLICAVTVFALVVAIFWYGGVDYMHRGVAPAYAVFCALVFAALGATCPYLDRKEAK
jgi:Mg/Co/Ni transporter MgtE